MNGGILVPYPPYHRFISDKGDDHIVILWLPVGNNNYVNLFQHGTFATS